MNKYIFLLTCLVGMAACTDHKDLYDPNLTEKEYEKNWKEQFGDIDPNQTWNMAVSRHATINLLEDALSEYKIQLYTADPLYDSSALLLASHSLTTDASGAGSVSFDFDMPKNIETIYAVRVDSHGRRLVRLAEMDKDGNVKATFGSVGSRGVRVAVTGELPTMEAPYTETEVNQLIADAYDLKNGLQYNEYGGQQTLTDFTNIAKVAKGYTVKVTTNYKSSLAMSIWSGYATPDNNGDQQYGWVQSVEVGKIKLIIAEGGVFIPQTQEIAGMDVIVATGGTLDLTERQILLNHKSRIIVMPGGKIVDKNKANTEYQNINNDSGEALIYNAGEIDINKINMNNAPLYNAEQGVLKASAIYFANSTVTSVLTNWGKVIATNVTGSGNQGTINNGCFFKVNDDFQVNYLNQGQNTSLECNKMNFFGGITLRENSILRATEMVLNETQITYCGTDAGQSLVSAKMVGHVYGNFSVMGNIFFEADAFEDGHNEDSEQSQYYSYYKLIHDAIKAGNALGLTKVGEATLSIPEGDCTGGGNNPVEEVKPTPVKTPTWIIACEDLGDTDDFDFNDIVIGITYDNSAQRLTVTPLAAGGTLRSVVYYNNMEVGEIHEMLGGSSSSMINTHSKGTPGDSKVIESVSSFDIKANMGGFSIKISKTDGENDSQIYAPNKGGIPQMICVPGTWVWPTERTSIEGAYTDFPHWCGDVSNTSWINSVVEGKVVK